MTAEFYTLLYKKISHIDEDLGELLKELASEEKNHEKQVDKLKTLYLEESDSFSVNEKAANESVALITSLNAMINKYTPNLDAMTPSNILQAIDEIEHNLESGHHSLYIEVENSEIKSLLNSLILSDAAHKEKVSLFKKNHNK